MMWNSGAAVDVRGAEELAHVPAAAGLVLRLFLRERVGLVREMAAEDDCVRPDVADDVGNRIGGQGAQVGAFDAGRALVEEVRGRADAAAAGHLAQPPAQP